jgi:hypothetical protein
MQLVRSEVRRNCMAATAAPQFAAHQWGCQRRRQLRARHRCVFSWRNRRRERKHDECREPWWWPPLGSRRERVLKVLPHIESAVQFKVSSSTSPGAYFGPRPWLFGATVVASVLQKIPGAEATLSETQFSAEQEDALLRFPDCNFAILNDASGLDEDEVVIKHDRDSAVFLPRTREHLEAAAYIAWREGIRVVRGLSQMRTAWCKGGVALFEIQQYIRDNSICTFYGSYTEPELRIHNLEFTGDITAALPAALRSWNLNDD